MQRMQPKNPEGDAQLAATYQRITKTRGYVSNILMSLSHAPAGLEAFAAYGEYVRYGTELPGRVRELCVLAIAAGNQYAWSHHHPHAIKAGLTQRELDSLESDTLPDGTSVAGKRRYATRASSRRAERLGTRRSPRSGSTSRIDRSPTSPCSAATSWRWAPRSPHFAWSSSRISRRKGGAPSRERCARGSHGGAREHTCRR